MGANVGLTVHSITSMNSQSEMAIDVKGGSLYNYIKMPAAMANNQYWMVIFDRKTLKVVENFIFTDNSTVPSQVSAYDNNPEYFYVLTTHNMQTNNLPVGAFYKWLRAEGSGVELSRIEQAAGALNCASWSMISYTLVDIFGPKTANTFEFSNLTKKEMINTLELMPLDIGGQTMYSPVSISE